MDRLGLTPTVGVAAAVGVLTLFTLSRVKRGASAAGKPKPEKQEFKDICILYDPDDPTYGGKTLEPGQRKRAAVDIIAVHGLASSSERAWTDRKTGTLWLKEFLPADLDHRARIITFNHNSQWGAYSLTKPFEGYAKEFLLAVDRVREGEDERRRPIIFVGHSFGGLLIKQALVMANEASHKSHYENIMNYTAGVLFLGVPHRGSKYTTLANVIAFATHLLNSNNMLLKYMEYKSTVGKVLQDKYHKACVGKFDQICFYECVPMYQLGISTGRVVDQESATMSDWGSSEYQEIALDADHKGMNKYATYRDPNYAKVAHQLERITDAVTKGKMEILRLSTTEIACIQSFVLADYATYRTRIYESWHEGTLHWVENDTLVKNWMARETGFSFLWVSGNPGCGKSVLSAYLSKTLEDAAAKDERMNVIYFFCDDKEQSQRTANAVLRGLIHQLLTAHPRLVRHAIQDYNSQGETMLLSTDILWKIFTAMLTDTITLDSPGTYCVLDGLDECEETSRQELLARFGKFFAALEGDKSKPAFVKVLMTSRPLAEIQNLLERYPHSRLKMEDEEAHISQDIELFSVHQARWLARTRGYNPKLEEKVAQTLVSGADGNFLWVAVTVSELSRTLTQNVEKKLKTLPTRMDDLYALLLHGIEDEVAEFAKKVLLCVSTASRPLTVDELAIACNLDLNTPSGTEDGQWDSVNGNSFEKDVELIGPILKVYTREVIAKTDVIGPDRGFTDRVAKYGTPGRTIHLVHQSAKEFLFNTIFAPGYSNILRFAIDPVAANVYMSEICLYYLSRPEFEAGPLDAKYTLLVETEMKMRSSQNPFMIYSGQYWAQHLQRNPSKEAQARIWPRFRELAASDMKINNAWQIFCFTTKMWPLEHKLTIGMYEPSGALEIAAYFGLDEWVTLLIDDGADLNAGSGMVGNALQAAMLGEKESTIRLLLEKGAGVNDPAGIHNVTPFEYACGLETCVGRVFEVFLNMTKDVNVPSGCASGLHWAATTGDAWKVRRLLDRGADINAFSEVDGTPLHIAVAENREQVIQLLIERGADVDGRGPSQRDSRCRTTNQSMLTAAVSSCDRGILRMLLAHGAGLRDNGLERDAAFATAVSFGRLGHMELLLDYGGDDLVNKYLPSARSRALHIAAHEVDVKTVKFLLDRGADVNMVTENNGSFYSGETALQAAAGKGSEDVIRLLIQHGADVNTGVDASNAALEAAAASGVPSAVRCLLAHGASPNASAVHAAVLAGMYPTLFELLLAGAPVTPSLLHVAVSGYPSRWAYTRTEEVQYHEMVIRMLLWAGADPDAPDDQGRTALEVAEEHVRWIKAGGRPGWLKREPTLEMSEAAVRILKELTGVVRHGILERQWRAMRETVQWLVRPSERRKSELDVYVDHMQKFRLVDAASASN